MLSNIGLFGPVIHQAQGVSELAAPSMVENARRIEAQNVAHGLARGQYGALGRDRLLQIAQAAMNEAIPRQQYQKQELDRAVNIAR